MAFEVNQKFIAQLETEEDILKHTFRIPNPREWQEFNSLRFRGATQKIKTGEATEYAMDIGKSSGLEAAETLWDNCIENVEGYTIDGQPLSCETKGWREKIWLPHKVAAVGKLVDFYDGIKEKQEKN